MRTNISPSYLVIEIPEPSIEFIELEYTTGVEIYNPQIFADLLLCIQNKKYFNIAISNYLKEIIRTRFDNITTAEIKLLLEGAYNFCIYLMKHLDRLGIYNGDKLDYVLSRSKRDMLLLIKRELYMHQLLSSFKESGQDNLMLIPL